MEGSPTPPYSEVMTKDADAQRACQLTGQNMNLLPLTQTYTHSNTWIFYEPFIHVLEGASGYDFGPKGADRMDPSEWTKINWAEIQYVIQLIRGETPEELEDQDDTELEEQAKRNKSLMTNCRNYVSRRFGHSFGIPDPENLPWNDFDGLD